MGGVAGPPGWVRATGADGRADAGDGEAVGGIAAGERCGCGTCGSVGPSIGADGVAWAAAVGVGRSGVRDGGAAAGGRGDIGVGAATGGVAGLGGWVRVPEVVAGSDDADQAAISGLFSGYGRRSGTSGSVAGTHELGWVSSDRGAAGFGSDLGGGVSAGEPIDESTLAIGTWPLVEVGWDCGRPSSMERIRTLRERRSKGALAIISDAREVSAFLDICLTSGESWMSSRSAFRSPSAV